MSEEQPAEVSQPLGETEMASPARPGKNLLGKIGFVFALLPLVGFGLTCIIKPG
jgi:hypothetical protein